MKSMKKLASLLLALVMVFSLATTAFAAANEGTLTGGSIKITNAVGGQTYKAYQIMYLESYNAEANAYAYKANTEWATWLATQTEYVTIDTQGYITWAKKDTDGNPIGAADFAKAAAAQLAGKTAAGSVAPTADGEATITGLNLGYYLVDTTMGSLCSLDTAATVATVTDKNPKPTIEKQVKEGETWGESNTAKIGDTVNFKITVHAKHGAQNYVVHDKMSEGLTFNASSVAVKVGNTTLTAGTHYNVVTENICAATETSKACTFHIVFTQTYLDSITTDTDIVIEYTAVLNEKAVISTDANTNDTKLGYGDENETEWDQTKTYTFKFDLVKTDSSNKVLDGAKFELYDAKTAGNKIPLVKESEATYRVATADEQKAESFKSAVIETKNGQAVVKGLDANTTYWLEETEAPNGYNKLGERAKVEMKEANLTATVTESTWTEGGVHVINNAGSELPSTGGMGTTLFYTLGGILMLAAVVLLVTKKRMNMAE